MDTHKNVTIKNNMDSKAIADFLNSMDSHGGISVLGRTHAILRKLSQELDVRHVGHVYVGEKSGLVGSERFQKFHAFLKLMVNPYDNFSFLLIWKILGLTREEYVSIRASAAKNERSHYQEWLSLADENNTQTFQFWFTVTAVNYGLRQLVEMIGSIGEISAWEDEEEIIDFICDWIDSTQINATVAEYLDWLATYDIQDEINEVDEDKMILMTIHAAKGLEWPSVVIAGVNEGLLPSKQAIKNDDIEAERRLAYVAWTRAMDQLILAVRPEKSIDERGHQHESPISRFVGESV